MQETKLLQLIKTFSPFKIKEFRKFIGSSYYNIHQDVVALFSFLEKLHPSFKPKKTTREKAFEHVFGKSAYNDLKMRRVMSQLLHAAENFLVTQSIRENKVSSSIELLKIYRERNLPKHFNTIYQKALTEQQQHRSMDLYYHYDQYRIELEEEDLLQQQQVRRETTNLQQVSDHLDTFYIIHKLKQSCAIVSYQNVFKQEYELKLVNEILAHLKTHHYDIPLLNMYHYGLLTLMEPEVEDHFFNLKKQLFEKSASLPREEAVALQTISRNYCVKMINSGKAEFIRELFNLYRLGLESTALLDGSDHLSPSAYKNTVAVGLRLKEFDWIADFIREFSKKLEPQYQHDYFNLNLAKLYFAKEEYDKVLPYLTGIDYKDIFVVMDARTLLLKTYYELDEYDALVSQFDSFKQFLKRRKELAYHSNNYLNIIKYTRQLTRISGTNKTEKEKLRSRLEKEKTLTEKDWLLEKLGEL